MTPEDFSRAEVRKKWITIGKTVEAALEDLKLGDLKSATAKLEEILLAIRAIVSSISRSRVLALLASRGAMSHWRFPMPFARSTPRPACQAAWFIGPNFS